MLFLLLLVAGAYLLRIGDLSIRGEEPRRAQVALEILQSGDWIVPHQQGTIYNTSRPPLQNWLIAFSMVLCGTREAWAIRLHSVLAMLLTAWLIYGYALVISRWSQDVSDSGLEPTGVVVTCRPDAFLA